MPRAEIPAPVRGVATRRAAVSIVLLFGLLTLALSACQTPAPPAATPTQQGQAPTAVATSPAASPGASTAVPTTAPAATGQAGLTPAATIIAPQDTPQPEATAAPSTLPTPAEGGYPYPGASSPGSVPTPPVMDPYPSPSQ